MKFNHTKFILIFSMFLMIHQFSFGQCQQGDPDSDNDGICDSMDICPNSPLNLDLDNDGICDSEVCDVANFENFEVGYWIWNVNSITYSRILNTQYALSGSYALKLYSNDPIYSLFKSDKLDLSNYNQVELTLNFQTISYSNGQSFDVQISNDNGSTYNQVKLIEYGTDFTGNTTPHEIKIYFVGPFTSETRIKVQSYASGTIYFDDIYLEYCLSCGGAGDPNGNGHCDCYNNLDSDNDGICDGEDICPNLDNALLGSSCNDGDPCTANDIWISKCSCQGSVLPDSDNDGICDNQDTCPDVANQIDIDKDGIPYCSDSCVDVNENGICDDVDNESINEPLKLYFSKWRGFYNGNTSVELFCSDPQATILYSTDWGVEWKYDSFNSVASTYTSPINISGHKQIRALAFTDNDTTEIQSHTYLDGNQYSPQELAVFKKYPVFEFAHVSENNRSFDELTIMEVFYPHIAKEGTSAPAGIRNRKWGLDQDGLFRLYFRSEYGMSKLDYELFPDVNIGAQSSASHDKLNLHGGSQDGFNAIWFGAGTLMRDRFFQHLQLETNGNGPRGQYYLMFDKGNFIGVKNTEEVPQQGYMEEYFGNGEKQDYGVQTYYSDELLPGNSYETIQDKTDFYNAIDVTNFVDYCLVQWLAGNHDWGLNNVDVAGLINGPYYHWAFDMHASSFEGEWIQGTYVYTTYVPGNDIDLLMDFADRIQIHFFDNGAFEKENLLRSWLDLKADLDAIVPFVANEEIWDRAVMDNYNKIHKNAPILLNWLQNNGYYPSLEPVNYNLPEGDLPAGSILDMSHNNPMGEIYYTLNGQDPRMQGGAINPNAILYSGSVSLIDGTVQVKARVKENDVWSASKQMVYQVGNKGLTLNEIHFNPLDASENGSEYEYVEIKNTGYTSVNLEYFRLQGGIRFKFDYNRSPIINPGEFIVLAENDSVFQQHFGFAPDGEYLDKLSNKAERISIVDTRLNEIDAVDYSEDFAPCADIGFTLSFDPNGTDNSLANQWFSSTDFGGTPGEENIIDINEFNNVIINEIHYNPSDSIYYNVNIAMNDTIAGSNFEFIELKNVSPNPIDIDGIYFNKGIELLINSSLILPANGFAVFAKDAFWFEQMYGFAPDGEYDGKLNNGGENIQLINCNGALVDSLNYSDLAPWNTIPDEGEYSLAYLIDVNDNDEPTNWAVQSVSYTPGAENEFCSAISNSTYIIDVACNGESSGSIIITTTGGTAPYTYLWSNGSSIQNITNLSAGNYTLTTTDSFDCSIEQTYSVNEPTPIIITDIHIDETILGANNGEIDLSVQGGTLPYSYNWSNGGSNEDITNLSPGIYSVTVTDFNNCSANYSVTIESTPCINNGGDSDNDGICADTDCDDNNASIGITGSICNDDNACTTNDVYDANCNCNGTYIDNDNDGYCFANDPDDNDACNPDDTGADCSNNNCNFIANDNFESSIGIWRDGGNDCSIVSNNSYASSGVNSIRLRDNSSTSIMFTNDLDLSNANQVNLSYGFKANSMESGENFLIEVSPNGGSSYVILKDWIRGVNFQNNAFYSDIISIPQVYLTANTVFRIRCDASGNNDQVYIDDVVIEVCNDGGNCTPGLSCDDNDICTINDIYDTNCNCTGTFEDSDNDGVCDETDICANGNDNIDVNANGIPDDCENGCTAQTGIFADNPLRHVGSGLSTTTINFNSTAHEVSFLISDISSKTNGNPSKRYVDVVRVSYVNVYGDSNQFGQYLGTNQSSQLIALPEPVLSVSISLEDGYDGNSNDVISVGISIVNYCEISNNNKLIDLPTLSIFPNPSNDFFNVIFDSNTSENYSFKVVDLTGRTLLENSILGTGNYIKEKVDVANWKPGLYIVLIESTNSIMLKQLIIY